MDNSIPLGRIFGISLRVDWSWTFIFLLVTWNLAAGVLPRLNPSWGPGLTWALAVIAALLFFASVLAHELAHSLVAKAKGLPVRNIKLFLFGGVSNIQREPASPGAEFLIAIVGPITSIVLGIIFLLLGGATMAELSEPMSRLVGLHPVTALLLWLGPINILVGVFNLIPGFPLDGGRVLRSILWGATGNLRTATRWASWVGQAIGWLFIVAGISMIFGARVPFFGTGLVSGLWLAFIGWFLTNAAAQSYRQLVIQDVLEGVPVNQLMRSDVPTIQADASIGTLVHDRIMGTDERAFPVLRGNDLVGLVSIDDTRKAPRDTWDVTEVSRIMTPVAELATVVPQADASEVLDTLASRDVNQVPVIQDGQLLGMVRRRDILKWLQLHSEQARL